jgi:hypothetical protein
MSAFIAHKVYSLCLAGVSFLRHIAAHHSEEGTSHHATGHEHGNPQAHGAQLGREFPIGQSAHG